MTEDEKRRQKADLLLRYEETQEELEHLRLKAWNVSQEIEEVSRWLADSREMRDLDDAQVKRDENIRKKIAHYRAAIDFDAIVALRDDLKRVKDILRTLAEHKQIMRMPVE